MKIKQVNQNQLFEPELGQAVSGNQWKKYQISGFGEECLQAIMTMIEVVHRCNPGRNSGEQFDGRVFSAHAYSWWDEDQLWNFKCGEIEVSWYKYLGRSMSSNIDVFDDEWREITKKCMKELLEG